ncbi:MAG: ABC transporter permease [Roseiflexaceae bacterium]|nr:ABC transporter permease [Roseiflexus sp.]MDW8214213.1 ABC transporter permease [Roseiflexaceae bacterium]
MAADTLASDSQPREGQIAALLRRNERLQLGLLLFPGLFWLVTFFALPLVVVVLYSFAASGPGGRIEWTFTLNNYRTLFTESLYVNAYWRSIWAGVWTTLACLILGYPLAYYIVRRPPRWRTVLLFLILIPFWTNFLVRTYAWMLILSNNGIINSAIQALGLPSVALYPSEGAVLVGLIYGSLPFMVLPIYASLARFDFTLMEAAADLGANQVQAFLRVMLPLTMPGVAAGSVLVFIPTVGQFVVSDLLGGAKVDYLGNLLQRLFTRSNPPNWPLGSAMAIVFMIVLTVAIIIYFRVTTEEDR